MEGRVAAGHAGKVAAGHFEGDRPAEAVTRDDHVLDARSRQGLFDARLDQCPHALAVLVKCAGRGLAVVHGLGRGVVAEHVDREGVVAHFFRQHVGALTLVVVHSVPVVNDDDEARGFSASAQ